MPARSRPLNAPDVFGASDGYAQAVETAAA